MRNVNLLKISAEIHAERRVEFKFPHLRKTIELEPEYRG